MDKNVEFKNVVAEMRSIVEAGLTAENQGKYDELEARSKEIKANIDADKKVKEMESELRSISGMQIATKEPADNLRSKLMASAKEMRAINIGGTGSESILPEIVKAMGNKKDVLSKLKFVSGGDSKTKIPVLSAYPDVEDGLAENGAITTNATNILDAVYLEPKAASINLPVSAEALYLSGIAIEGQLPGIFAEGFAEVIYNGFLTGTGTAKMTGIFTDSRVTQAQECGAVGEPSWLDLAKLASKIRAKTDNGALFVPDGFINGILGSTTASHEMVKNEFLMKGTIRGVPVVEVPLTLATTTGATLAIAMPFDNYAYTIIDGFGVNPVMTKDSTTTYFRALSFIDGKIVNVKNVWKLTAK